MGIVDQVQTALYKLALKVFVTYAPLLIGSTVPLQEVILFKVTPTQYCLAQCLDSISASFAVGFLHQWQVREGRSSTVLFPVTFVSGQQSVFTE